MNFEIGDRVRVIDNRGIQAKIGAEGIVTRELYPVGTDSFIGIEWDNTDARIFYIDNNNQTRPQMDGGYYPRSFELVHHKEDEPLPIRLTRFQQMAEEIEETQ